jgi:hypothetical protein
MNSSTIVDLRQYVEWLEAAHASDCPGGKACNCACQPLNEAVMTIVDRLRTDRDAADAQNKLLWKERSELIAERDALAAERDQLMK